jgi:hypothetical protein
VYWGDDNGMFGGVLISASCFVWWHIFVGMFVCLCACVPVPVFVCAIVRVSVKVNSTVFEVLSPRSTGAVQTIARMSLLSSSSLNCREYSSFFANGIYIKLCDGRQKETHQAKKYHR